MTREKCKDNSLGNRLTLLCLSILVNIQTYPSLFSRTPSIISTRLALHTYILHVLCMHTYIYMYLLVIYMYMCVDMSKSHTQTLCIHCVIDDFRQSCFKHLHEWKKKNLFSFKYIFFFFLNQ